MTSQYWQRSTKQLEFTSILSPGGFPLKVNFCSSQKKEYQPQLNFKVGFYLTIYCNFSKNAEKKKTLRQYSV